MYVREDKIDSNSCNFIEIPNNAWESYASSCAARTAIKALQERVQRDNEPGSKLFAQQIHSSLNKHTSHHHSMKRNKKKTCPLASGKFGVT
jgi:hypothetical protein